MIVPLGRLLYVSVQTKSVTKKQQLFSLFFTLLCLNLLCLFIECEAMLNLVQVYISVAPGK